MPSSDAWVPSNRLDAAQLIDCVSALAGDASQHVKGARNRYLPAIRLLAIMYCLTRIYVCAISCSCPRDNDTSPETRCVSHYNVIIRLVAKQCQRPLEFYMKLLLVDVGKEVTIERLLPLYLQLLRDESSEVCVAPLRDMPSLQEVTGWLDWWADSSYSGEA